MADARLKLTLVQEALQADPPKEGQQAGVQRVLDRYTPSIAKRVRAQATSELLQRLGAQTVEEASQLAALRAERDARPTASEEAKHGRAMYWRGAAHLGLVGVFVGAGLVYAAFAWSQAATLDSAADYGARMVVSGAALDAARQPRTCVPGEPLSDGTRCPASETGPRQDVQP